MQRGAFNLTLAGVKPEYSFSSVILKTKNERTGTHIWQHRRSFNEAVCRGALRSWACLFGCCFFSILLWYIFGIVRWLNQCYLFQKKDYFCLFFSQKQLCPKLWWATPRLVVISWHHKDELKQEQRQSRDSQTFCERATTHHPSCSRWSPPCAPRTRARRGRPGWWPLCWSARRGGSRRCRASAWCQVWRTPSSRRSHRYSRWLHSSPLWHWLWQISGLHEDKYFPGCFLTCWTSQSSGSSFKQADQIQLIGGH